MDLKYEWWEYLLIPFIAGFVGYFTNVIALQMTFYPIEFFGIELFRLPNEPWGLFGWQGIIPSKARKMATISFELFTKRLFNIQEIFRRLDPKQFSEKMETPLLLLMDEIVNQTAQTYIPTQWEKIPKAVKDDLIVTIHHEGNAFMEEFMSDMQDHVDDIVDIKHLTVNKCVENKELIVQIFQECGEKEFVFIRRSGFYFGFMFGVLQMAVWFVYDADWILPVAGFAVGWFTNYLALKVIFRPLEPTKILCWMVQGIFLKRQKEVSATFARVVMTEILHVPAIWEAILKGPLSNNFNAMLRAHTLIFTERLLQQVRPFAVVALGNADTYQSMKEDIARCVIEKIPTMVDWSYEYTQEALDMENTVREKMQELPPAEFEGVLHPAFEEDEIELIALGGLLGAIVGVIQLFTLFG